MTKATISSTGQIVIPKAVRDRLNLKPGTEVAIGIEGETLVMRRLVRHDAGWHTMRGLVSNGPSLTEALEEEHAAELAREDIRLQGH